MARKVEKPTAIVRQVLETNGCGYLPVAKQIKAKVQLWGKTDSVFCILFWHLSGLWVFSQKSVFAGTSTFAAAVACTLIWLSVWRVVRIVRDCSNSFSLKASGCALRQKYKLSWSDSASWGAYVFISICNMKKYVPRNTARNKKKCAPKAHYVSKPIFSSLHILGRPVLPGDHFLKECPSFLDNLWIDPECFFE